MTKQARTGKWVLRKIKMEEGYKIVFYLLNLNEENQPAHISVNCQSESSQLQFLIVYFLRFCKIQ